MRSPSSRILDSERKSLSAIAAIAVGERGAFVLQEINHWIEHWVIRRDKEHFHEGYYWVWNSYKQWQRAFPFIPEPSLKKVILDLERKNILISAEFNRNRGNRTKWYRINYSVLDRLLVEAEAKYEKIMSDPSDLGDPTIVVEDPMVGCERSDGGCERSDHSCDRSTLSTDLSTDLSTYQSTKERKTEPLSVSPSGRDQESEPQNNISSRAQTKNPSIQDPQTPKPLSPVTPENFGKPIKRDTNTEKSDRKLEVDALLANDEFRKFLFRRMRTDTPHYSDKLDTDYALHTGKYLAKASRMDEDGDERITIVRLYKDAYDHHKAEQARIEEERSRRERERQQEADEGPRMSLEERKRLTEELKLKVKLNKLTA